MGVYNKVLFVSYCPRCGGRLNNFQSKDDELSFDKVNIDKLDNWYTECPDCNLFIQCRHIHPSECKPRFNEMAFIAFNYLKEFK